VKVAIAYSTKDRVELSEQTYPMIHCVGVDLHWIDGSTTAAGKQLPLDVQQSDLAFPNQPLTKGYSDVRGGADAAIVFALTQMLAGDYDIIGLCENDVLLAPGWFEAAMQLFEKGKADGLNVGAVSPRCYEDRILIQREGYAVCHNLGAGIVLFTRESAELILKFYRTGWWHDTRSIFAQLSGIDIGRYAAFRGNEQWTTADWHFDAVLAQHGLASLALTPSLCEMIGQEPSLEEQGLKLVKGDGDVLHNENAFALFVARTAEIRAGTWRPDAIKPIQEAYGTYTYFAHQLPHLVWSNGWKLKWSQGLGPFAWRADMNHCTIKVRLFGPVTFLISGGKSGAHIVLTDTDSGYEITPDLPTGEQQIAQIQMPSGLTYREIVLICSAGAVFYGVQTVERQPVIDSKFDYHSLPPV
jgi:hypothetical protein